MCKILIHKILKSRAFLLGGGIHEDYIEVSVIFTKHFDLLRGSIIGKSAFEPVILYEENVLIK